MKLRVCFYTAGAACFAWLVVHDGWLIAVGWVALGAAIGLVLELWKGRHAR